jgi:hypothetical protein
MNNFTKMMLALLLTAGLFACNKQDETTSVSDRELISIEAQAEGIFDEVQEIADQAMRIGSSGLKSVESDDNRLGNCVTITVDTTVMPRVMTIDFGEVNCLCNDGKYRRGRIIVTFNGRWRRPGTVVTHTFENYHVNDNHVQGTKVMTNLGFNAQGKMQFRNTTDGSITFANNGSSVAWTSEKLRTWIEGRLTPPWNDDVYLIEGNSSVVHSSGRSRERVIIEPLRRELSCRWFVSGTVETTPSSGPVRLLNYGDGVCDNLATVTVGDSTFTITLR